MTKMRFILILAALLLSLALVLTSCTDSLDGGNTDNGSSDNGSSDNGNSDNGDNNGAGTTDPDGTTGDGTEGGDGNTDDGNGSTEGDDDNTEGGDDSTDGDNGSTEGDNDNTEGGDGSTDNEGAEVVDLKSFTVITVADAADFVELQTEKLLAAIKSASGTEIGTLTDAAEQGSFELNVGKTSRDITAFALNILDQTVDGDGYVIYVTTDAISIVGTTDAATGHAVKVFYENYVKSSDGGILNTDAELIITKSYTASKNEIINGDVEIEVLQGPVTLFQPSGHTEEYGTPIKSTSAH